MKEYIIGCDWGTSSFRLRLIRITDRAILGEVISECGIGTTYDAWKKEYEVTGIAREEYFRALLSNHIRDLSELTGAILHGVTVVISGMASSSIGMVEMDYAPVPFAVDGSMAVVKQLDADERFSQNVIIVSGVRTADDVMRGEETQLTGLFETSDVSNMTEATFIFPGTHSKHLYVTDRMLTGFNTLMTGEVFNLMARRSILKDSVEMPGEAHFSPDHKSAFLAGVRKSGASNILNSLFTVRINQLFHLLEKDDNGMFLSGLLIGSELRSLLPDENRQIVLCCGANLSAFYLAAIEEMGLADRTIVIPPELVDRTAVLGQIQIFKHFELSLNKISI